MRAAALSTVSFGHASAFVIALASTTPDGPNSTHAASAAERDSARGPSAFGASPWSPRTTGAGVSPPDNQALASAAGGAAAKTAKAALANASRRYRIL
jgi:hypothetical protein